MPTQYAGVRINRYLYDSRRTVRRHAITDAYIDSSSAASIFRIHNNE